MNNQREPVIPTLQQQDRYLESKRTGQGLDKNFKLFNDFLKVKSAGMGRVTLMLVISFYHHFISYMRQYKNLITKQYSTETTLIDQMLNASQYTDVVELMKMSDTVQYGIFVVALLFTLGLSLLYLIIYILGPEFKPRKKFIGKLFVLLCNIYIWVLHFPCMVVFFQIILNSTVDVTHQILNFLAILGLICGVMNIIVLSTLMHNNWDNKKDYFNTENVIYLTCFQLSRFVLAFFISFSPGDYSYLWLFMMSTFLLYTLFLGNLLYGGGFLAFGTRYTRYLFTYLLIVILSASFSTIVDELHRKQTNLQTTENVSVYFTFIFLFLLFSVGYNMRHKRINSIEFDIHQLSPSSLNKQIYTTLAFLEISLTDISIDTFFKGALQRHMDSECQHPTIKGEGRCYCKKKRVFDSKKRKEIRVEEWMNNKPIIMKFLIKSWIETYLSQKENDVQTQILYARFMFTKFNNHQLALHILTDLEKRFTFILDRYKSYQLKEKIIKFIRLKNSDSYKGRLEIESALYVEEQIDNIKDNITSILKQNCNFWSNLQQTTIDLSEMDDLLQRQFKKIEETKGLWIKINNYLEYKKKWKFYYAWFTLYILNKKVKNRILENFQGLQVNENDIFSEELQENNADEDVISVKSGFIENDKIDIKSKKIIFDKKACIIQASDDISACIIRVNKQFTRIFGYKSEEVVRILPITNLMPDIYSRVHPQILLDYKMTGKASALYSQRKIFCIHKSGVMFTAWKFLKLYVDMNGQSQYVVMIRPTDFNNEKKHDFMIINNDWEINGMTNNVLSGLNFSHSLFSKINSSFSLINLLLFAPKLIQYSRIAPLINENRDLPIFGMMKNPKKKPVKQPPLQPVLEAQQSTSSKPKINVNMLGSSSLRQSVGKPISGMYSDIDFGSKILLPQQSLEQQQQQPNLVPASQQLAVTNERDKFLQHQMSSISDKNDFDDFNKQIGQFDKIQNLNLEMEKKAEEQIKEIKETQFNNNYQRIATEYGKEKDALSEDNISRDEMIEKIKGQILLDGKVNAGEQIQFRMKIPENMDKIIEYYSSQKSKMYQIKKLQDEQVKHEEVQDQGKKKDKEKVLIKQGTQQREFRKKARLMFQKAAEMKRCQDDVNFYELIVEIYQKFLQQCKTRTYKVICTIQFLKIKDDRVGIMKLVSINEIMKAKKVTRDRDTNRKQSIFLKNLQPSRELGATRDLGRGSFNKSGINLQTQFENAKFVSMASEESKQQISPADLQPVKLTARDKTSKANGLGYQMQPQNADTEDDKDLLIDSKAFNKMINWDTFQQQFKMQQGTLNFSLNAFDNIFRKEDNNKPRKFLIKIAYLTWFLRLMFVTIITLNLITYFIKPYQEFDPMISQAQRIFSFSQMQTTIIETYDTLLDILIYQNITDFTTFGMTDKDTFYAYQLTSVQDSYEFIKAQMKDVNQLETFLDESIFYSDPIEDYTISGSANTTLTLDSRDFFNKFIMLEHQISMMDVQTLQNVLYSDPFVKFIRYVTVPLIYDQLNNAVIDLQTIVLNNSNSISQFVLIILILEGSLLVCGFVGLLIIIFWISQTYKAVLRIFTLIQKNDLNKIVKQQRFIETQFKYITNKDLEISGLQPKNALQRINSISSKNNFQLQQNFLLINEEEEQNMNKKREKNIIEKSLLRRLTIKLYLTYIVLVLLSAGASLAFFLTLKKGSDELCSLINIGAITISDFSDNQLLLTSVKERYYNETYYINTYLPKVSTLLVEQISNVQETPQISDPGYGNYYNGFQAIYYASLCEYLKNQTLLTDVEYTKCVNLLNGKLNQGIIAFNQFYLSEVQDYVLNDVSRFGMIDIPTIWNLNGAIDFIKMGFKELLTEWAADITDLINTNIALILTLLIVMLLFQLFVFMLIAEMYLVNQLNKTFSFYRLVYKSYMPNDIIQKEKIIRAQLIRYNIIKK